MSHASVLVVVEESELKAAGGKVEDAVTYQMDPFYEGGEWFKDGSRWDWWVIGGRFTGKLTGYDPESDERNYGKCKWCGGTGKRMDMWVADGCNGCGGTGRERAFHKHDETQAIAHYAFLRNRHWHEAKRLGFFGAATASECERHVPEDADVETMIRRCKHKDPVTGASIVVWNEPWEVWSKEFWKRFIEPLTPETLLVTVDYHV